MTEGIVEAGFGALLTIISFWFVMSPAMRRRVSPETRSTFHTFGAGAGFTSMIFGAQDLRPHLGWLAAYGYTFGALFAVFGVFAVIIRSRRSEDEAPAPLWKWTQRV